MVSNTDFKRRSLSEALKLREQAGELLTRLLADRESSERRTAESGKRDPMKFITGSTALETAIASTRDMMAQLDAVLVHAPAESPKAAPALAPRPAAGRPMVRTSARSQFRTAAPAVITPA